MKTSEHINELSAALAKAQGTFISPERNRAVKVPLKAGGSYTFHYTTLDRLLEMIRPGMAENGLSVCQSVGLDTDWVIVTTRILHASGQWIENELPVKPEGFSPQQVGSAITYGRRYSIAPLLGLASDEDDDGNLGSGHTSEEIRNSPPPKKANGKAKEIADQHGMTTGDKIAPPNSYATAQEKLPAIDTITKATKFVAWVKEKRVAKQLEAPEYAELDRAAAGQAIAVCQTAEDFTACEKLLRGMHGEMRLDEQDYLDICTRLADAKDAKLAAAA